MIPKISWENKRINGHVKVPTSEITYFIEQDISYMDVFIHRVHSLEKFENVIFKKGNLENSFIRIIEDNIETGGYELSIKNNKILVKTDKNEGVANALATLYHLISENKGIISCREIKDTPRMNWRGFMIDSCRHFFNINTIKQMVEECSLRKLNRFHWHLSDDQGYRIESKKYPKLNSVGSYRIENEKDIYGGYYTVEEINEIIEYAKKRGVEIIPEIDLPGHTSAMIASYPYLSCQKDKIEVPNSFGIFEKVLCVGDDKVIDFVFNLLEEVSELFPFEYFHIGGDEVPKKEWIKCSICQERMNKNKLKNEEDLQAWFTNQIIKYLKSKNKKVIGWNEILKSDKLDKSATIQYWDMEEGEYLNSDKAEERKYIYSNTANFYFDYSYTMIPLRQVFNNDMSFRNGIKIPEINVLGFEAELWSEMIEDGEKLQKMAFPRLLAVAESGWNRNVDYEEFVSRLSIELKKLKLNNVSYTSLEKSDPDEETIIKDIIKVWKPRVEKAKELNKEDKVEAIKSFLSMKLVKVLPNDKVEELIFKIF